MEILRHILDSDLFEKKRGRWIVLLLMNQYTIFIFRFSRFKQLPITGKCSVDAYSRIFEGVIILKRGRFSSSCKDIDRPSLKFSIIL